MGIIRWFNRTFPPKVPRTLQECFDRLDRLDGGHVRKQFNDHDETFVPKVHMVLGMWIRNGWGLWSGGNKLTAYFNKIGINHPDDMSGIILLTYHRYVHRQPFKLYEQVAEYKKHWEQNESTTVPTD